MQTVTAAFTAEEHDEARKIAQSLLVSWKRFSTLANRTFTIGVSTIGGNHVIGLNPGAIGSPGNYQYFDESDYVMSLGWERGFKMPLGGIAKALAEARLDNTSGRFTPRYMGGSSEIFTAVHLPKRPMIINAGFDVGGANIMVPQFSGITTEPAVINTRNKSVSLKAADYIDYFENKYLDTSVMFTGQRSDQVMQTLSQQLGMSTAQFDYDTGINVIPFGHFPSGTKFADAFSQLAEAEGGRFYQDEQGIFKFENRYHWDNSPYNTVQKLVLTGQVLDAESPNDSNLVNVVEIRSKKYKKQPEQIIYRLNPFDSIELAPSSTTSVFLDFDDAVLSMTTPTSSSATSYFQAFSNPEGTGTDYSSSVSVSKVYRFAYSVKIDFTNASTSRLYITNLIITGRVAKSVSDLYSRVALSSSLTAYDAHVVNIENPFIQDEIWAESLANMIVTDFGVPEKLQKITIRAIPELQLGDLISWQGRYWRIYDIKSTLDPSVGFIQELMLLQRSLTSYFRIGVSTIGGSDKIAP